MQSVLPASDPDGDALTFSIATPPKKGTLVVVDHDTGAFVYTPAKLESGADLFTFQVSDGQATSAVTPFAISIAEPSRNVALHRHAEVTIPGQLASAPELLDGDLTTSWMSHPGMSGDLGLVIDLGESRRVWRVVIHWGEEGHASAYELRVTNRAVFRTVAGQGGSEDIRVAANWFARFLVLAIKRLPEDWPTSVRDRRNHLSRNPPAGPGLPRCDDAVPVGDVRDERGPSARQLRCNFLRSLRPSANA